MSFAPHLSLHLRTFELGLSTLLEHEDVLGFLSRLPSLKELILSYHLVYTFLGDAFERANVVLGCVYSK
jgi:hypothetical protein